MLELRQKKIFRKEKNKMARGLTDSPEPTAEASQVDLKQISDMLYAIFCAVQEINAKMPEQPQEGRLLNGL